MSSSFRPDYTVPPGEVIQELAQSRNWSFAELATVLGLSIRDVAKLLQGKLELTEEMAGKLEAGFGAPPARFWINMETNYRADRVRLGLDGAVD